MSKSSYIIDVTKELSAAESQYLQTISADLESIKKAVPAISNIVLRGGAALDALFGIKPSDYDLFYSYKEDGQIVTDCRCGSIEAVIEDINFTFFNVEDIEFENSFEKEPRLDPIERTCGFASYHTGYISMFCIDYDGNVWTNADAFSDYRNRIYEIRYEGAIPWGYFPKDGDAGDYYTCFCIEFIRGISYMMKRNLSAGPKFSQLVEFMPYFFDTAFNQQETKEQIGKYARQKLGNRENIERFSQNHNFGMQAALDTALEYTVRSMRQV